MCGRSDQKKRSDQKPVGRTKFSGRKRTNVHRLSKLVARRFSVKNPRIRRRIRFSGEISGDFIIFFSGRITSYGLADLHFGFPNTLQMGSFVISGSAVIYILNPFSQIDRKRSIILGQITFSLCQSLTNAVDFVLISSIFWRCAVTLEISLFLYKGGAWRASGFTGEILVLFFL